MKFKQILLTTLLSVFFLTSFASEYYIATSDVNVRNGPGARHAISFTLLEGSKVELLSKAKDWYRVEYGEESGYVHSKYLKSIESESNTELSTSPQFQNTILWVTCISITFYLGFIIYRKLRDKFLLEIITHHSRGTKSERNLALTLLKCGIPEQNIFHDLCVRKSNGEFSQIDLVILTTVGIIVIEVKDYSGWIFGNGNQSQWTKVLAYGKQKYSFYNPIFQNNTHIAELRKQLSQFDDIPFYSMIVFHGDCVLKNINFVPHGTYIVKSKRVLEVIRNILRDNMTYHYKDENEVIRVLREAVTNGGIKENQIQHIKNVRDMLGTDRIFD